MGAEVPKTVQKLNKDLRSALCIIPPQDTWGQIQRYRCFKDKGFVRWPPHINLLYPFTEDTGYEFNKAAKDLAAALAGIAPFQVALRDLSFFRHKRTCTLWADPASQSLVDLQAVVQSVFPDCTELSNNLERRIAAFVPHLSLGQFSAPTAAEAAQQELQGNWNPVAFSVDRIQLISRRGHAEPFRVRLEVPLGGGKPQLLDVPYVATVSQIPPEGASEEARRYACSAAEAEGVWYFAYGANLSRQKLCGARGLTPLEPPRPACLPGWRLAFTHRGGMGNIMRLLEDEAASHTEPEVQGVAWRLSNADFATLTIMEHEYLPVELTVQTGGKNKGPLRAVAFITPPERLISDGLPPPTRYLKILQEGARESKLPATYRAWLDGHASIDQKQRGSEYYTSPDGRRPRKAFPKIRLGSSPDSQGPAAQRHSGPAVGRRDGPRIKRNK